MKHFWRLYNFFSIHVLRRREVYFSSDDLMRGDEETGEIVQVFGIKPNGDPEVRRS